MGDGRNFRPQTEERKRLTGYVDGQYMRPNPVGDGQAERDFDLLLRRYSDGDMCPMHMPGHKRKSVEEIEDMLGRERNQEDGSCAFALASESGDGESGDGSLMGTDLGSTGFHGGEPRDGSSAHTSGRESGDGSLMGTDLGSTGFHGGESGDGSLMGTDLGSTGFHGGEPRDGSSAHTSGRESGDGSLAGTDLGSTGFHGGKPRDSSSAHTSGRESGDGSLAGTDLGSTGFHGGKPGGERRTDIPVEHLDITEIDGFDNLHRPEGILRDLEGDLAALYHVPAAKLSVGGSTVGLLAAITAVTAPGDRVLIARNCHAAVYHAALVQGLAVDYLLPEADGSIAPRTVSEAFENNALARMIREMAEGKRPGLNAAGAPAERHLAGSRAGRPEEKPLKSGLEEISEQKTSDSEQGENAAAGSTCRNPAGFLRNDHIMKAAPYQAVVLTCPTYEGIMSDIAAIAKIVHSYGAVLVVDAAHGAHLGLSNEPIFPENPVHCGADLVVVSLHKTLPALTMTGAILVAEGSQGRASALASALDIYESSSPSYILLASIARMVRFLREHGAEAFHQYAQKLTGFYRAAEGLTDPAVLGAGVSPGENPDEHDAGKLDSKSPGNRSYIKKDPSKIVILSQKDIIHRLREDYHIELEMASLSYALAMTSLADSQENFDRLLAALADMNGNPHGSGNPALQTESPPYGRRRDGIEISGEEENNSVRAGESPERAAGDFVKQNSMKISESARAADEGRTQVWNEGKALGDDHVQAWNEGRTADDDHAQVWNGGQAWDQERTVDKGRGVPDFALDLPFTADGYKLPQQVLSIRDAYFAPSEAAAPAAAAGRISAAFVSVFPPEIPVLVPGERISEPELALLESAAKRGFTIHGLENGRVSVLK